LPFETQQLKLLIKMKSISITSLFVLSFLFFSCTPKAQNSTPTAKTTQKKVVANPIVKLNPVDFQKKVQAGNVQLVDVRTQREYAQGHIEGAIFHDYYQRNTFMTKMNTLDKSKPVYIYCLTGARSRSTAQKLNNAGFTKIYDLNGGVRNWYRSGLKLVK